MKKWRRKLYRYNNYHKHDHISNIFTPDTNTHAESYIKKSVEYGHTNYFTTNHGSMGDIFEAKTLCDKYGLKCIAGLEGYIVPNPLEKDKSNYHIIIIPKTDAARKKVNVISSRANIEGFYYKPRIFLDDLLGLDPNDVYITSACMAGLLKDEVSIEKILFPLYSHFKSNLLLEVQNHNNSQQKEINRKAITLSHELGLRLIAANDSHYIDEKDQRERLELLKGKHINYGDEDSFKLDFPDYETMFIRFQQQGVLTDAEIKEAIDNTLIFDECEEIGIDKTIKMPNIYPNLSLNERVDLLQDIVEERFAEIAIKEEIKGDELEKYKEGIRYEMQIIRDTNDEIHTADYFLFNEKNVDLAVNKYGGVLTRGGRGSCGSFYINRILGMTQLDRFKINLPIFPDRFASTARLLENRSLPDIDYNVKDSVPFVKASRELLGENGCYPMIAYGTMQIGEAFRNVCRSKGMSFEKFNDVAKNIERYQDSEEWADIIDEAKQYVGTVVSASVHPCAHILSDQNLLEEYGVVRLGEFLCVMITSSEADEYKVLKNDYLIVKVWKLIDETFKAVGVPIITAQQLLSDIKDNQRIWDLFKNGITCTLNQVDSDNGTHQAQEYGISSFEDGAFIAAAIRPSFDSWRDGFLKRIPYSTGSKDLDNVLEMTHHYILFQENLMQYFEWLGVSPAESIGLIKKISKKKIKQEDFDSLEVRLREAWIENTGSIDMFQETWTMIQSCMAYGFCSAHAAATSLDMCYGAYLKVHYPCEYYTVCFNNYFDDSVRTKKLKGELKYFHITLENAKFRHSSSQYTCNTDKRIIYKGLRSIKFLNEKIADELNLLGDVEYRYFSDLLNDIKEKTSVNARQLEILIKIDFFSEFGDINKLLKIMELWSQLYERVNIGKSKISDDLIMKLLHKYSDQESETRVEEIDVRRFAHDFQVSESDLLDCVKYQYVTEGNEKRKIPNGISTKKLINKFTLSSDIQMKYATKTVIGRFSKIRINDLLREYEDLVIYNPCSLMDRVSYQAEYLGYIDYVNSDYSWRYVVVTSLDTTYSPKFQGYSVGKGTAVELKIHKTKPTSKYGNNQEVAVSFTDIPLKDGDVIYINKIKKQQRQRKIDGKWTPIEGEYDWWIKDYYKVVNSGD